MLINKHYKNHKNVSFIYLITEKYRCFNAVYCNLKRICLCYSLMVALALTFSAHLIIIADLLSTVCHDLCFNDGFKPHKSIDANLFI